MTSKISSDQPVPDNPLHIAIIMDGNGRWANQRGLPRAAGHQAGFKVARSIIEAVGKRQHKALTLFAFSSENWRRPPTEVRLLLELFMSALQSEVDKLMDNNVHMRFVGERSAFPDKLRQQMDLAEQKTASNTGLKLSIAVNYGGRWDIVNAAQQVAKAVQCGEVSVADITEEKFSEYVCIPDCGDPDILIRTGGDQRISNYLLWQLAYSELFFLDSLWPDFSEKELDFAIDSFSQRERRFGQTGAQVSGESAASEKTDGVTGGVTGGVKIGGKES